MCASIFFQCDTKYDSVQVEYRLCLIIFFHPLCWRRLCFHFCEYRMCAYVYVCYQHNSRSWKQIQMKFGVYARTKIFLWWPGSGFWINLLNTHITQKTLNGLLWNSVLVQFGKCKKCKGFWETCAAKILKIIHEFKDFKDLMQVFCVCVCACVRGV